MIDEAYQCMAVKAAVRFLLLTANAADNKHLAGCVRPRKTHLRLNVALEFVQDDLEFELVVWRRPRPSIVNVPSMTADPQE